MFYTTCSMFLYSYLLILELTTSILPNYFSKFCTFDFKINAPNNFLLSSVVVETGKQFSARHAELRKLEERKRTTRDSRCSILFLLDLDHACCRRSDVRKHDPLHENVS